MIARGAVPLALCGAKGYGHTMGRMGRAALVMQASAPLALAFAAEHASNRAALALAAAFAPISFAGLLAIRRPRSQ